MRTIIAILLTFSLTTIYSADVTFVATSDANWSDNTAWSGSTAPVAGDNVIFDASSGSAVCTVDVTVDVGSILTDPTFTGDVLQNATVTVGNITFGGGHWDANGQLMNVSGNFIANGTNYEFINNGGTIHMTGSGVMSMPHWSVSAYKLICADAGQESAFLGSIHCKILEFGTGTVSGIDSGARFFVGWGSSNTHALINNGVSFTDNAGYYPKLTFDGSGYMEFDGGNYIGATISSFLSGTSSANLLGDLVCERIDIGMANAVFNTHGHSLTASALNIGYLDRSVTFNADGSTMNFDNIHLESNGTGNSVLHANGSTIYVESKFTTNAGTSFNGPESTIILDGDSNQYIDFGTASTLGDIQISLTAGVCVFENNGFAANRLQVDAGQSVQFEPGQSYTFTVLESMGTAAEGISLKSRTAGSEWFIANTGTAWVNYTTVQDSNASTGNTITAYNSTPVSNNTNWIFSTNTLALWDGGSTVDNNWSTAENWLGDVIPTATSMVLFDDLSDKNCDITTAVTVAGIFIEDDYDGTIDQQAAVTTGDFSTVSGTWNANAQTITASGNFFSGLQQGIFSKGASTVVLSGSGSVEVQHISNRIHNLTCAQTGQTTAVENDLWLSTLTLGDGMVTGNDSAASLKVGRAQNSIHALTNNGATFTNDGGFYPSLVLEGSGNMTFDGGNYGEANIGSFVPLTSTATFITDLTAGHIGMTGNTHMGLQDITVTISGQINIGYADRSPVLDFHGSIVTADSLYLEGDGGAATMNLGTATINVIDDFNVDAGTIINQGTSTVNMLGADTWTQVCNTAHQPLYILNLNDSGNGATYDLRDVFVTNQLNIVSGSVTSNGNTIVSGDLSITNGATYYGERDSLLTIAGTSTQNISFSDQEAFDLHITNTTALVNILQDINVLGATTIDAGASVVFSAGTTLLSNHVAFNGEDQNTISLSSSVAGTAWNLNANSNAVSHVAVSDSNASISQTPILAFESQDNTGNTNWIFGNSKVFTTTSITSHVSPAWTEGLTSSEVENVSVIVDQGSSFDAVLIGPNNWFVSNTNVPETLGIDLNQNAPIAVRISGNDGTINHIHNHTIEWTPIDLSEYSINEITIRKGDTVLVTAQGTGVIEYDINSDNIADYTNIPGVGQQIAFSQPGVFIVAAKLNGMAIGQNLKVNVVELNHLSTNVAVELKYSRQLTTTIIPDAFAGGVEVMGFNGAITTNTAAYGQQYNLLSSLKVNDFGEPQLLVRLLDGPAFVVKNVDEFVMENSQATNFPISAASRIGTGTHIIRPFAPNVELTFSMFATQTTFLGGATSFTINTSDALSSLGEDGFFIEEDPITGEIVGRFYFTMEVPPGETKSCFGVTPKQEGSALQTVGDQSSYNGNPCPGECIEKAQAWLLPQNGIPKVCVGEDITIKARIGTSPGIWEDCEGKQSFFPAKYKVIPGETWTVNTSERFIREHDFQLVGPNDDCYFTDLEKRTYKCKVMSGGLKDPASGPNRVCAGAVSTYTATERECKCPGPITWTASNGQSGDGKTATVTWGQDRIGKRNWVLFRCKAGKSHAKRRGIVVRDCTNLPPPPPPGGGGGVGVVLFPWDNGDEGGDNDGAPGPNTGETFFEHEEHYICAGPDISGTYVDFSVFHRIITHNTPESRDLLGKLTLTKVEGDEKIVGWMHNGQDYHLGQVIDVNEPGHSGGGVHTWHSGEEIFSVRSRNDNDTNEGLGKLTVKASVDPDPDVSGDGMPTVEAEIDIYVVRVDLDIDSDNTNGLDLPDRSTDEDYREYVEEDAKEVPINNGDTDQDMIPNYADFDAGDKFVPMIVELPEPIDLSKAKLKFVYSSSDPSVIGPAPDYAPISGSFRIWTVNGDAQRNKSSVIANGDFVPEDTWLDPDKIGLSDSQRTVTLYVEGVDTHGDTGVELMVDMTGTEEFICEDLVVFEKITIDLDIDSDNNNTLERSQVEDRFEGLPYDDTYETIGKIIPVNDGDRDADGVPDWADGFFDINTSTVTGQPQVGYNKSADFTKMILEIHENVDLDVAKIKFTYEESDPTDVYHEGTGTKNDPYKIKHGSGSFRIWFNKNGSDIRDQKAVGSSLAGDFVPSGEALELSDFFDDHLMTFYVESVTPFISDDKIIVEVDPLGDGNYLLKDTIRVRPLRINMVHDHLEFNDEISRGAVVALNNDDDNHNQGPVNVFLPDNKELIVNMEDDLSVFEIFLDEVTQSEINGVLSNAKVRLEITDGAGNAADEDDTIIKVWQENDKSVNVLNSTARLQEWTLKDFMNNSDIKTMYLEGMKRSLDVKDAELTIGLYLEGSSTPVAKDIVKVTVAELILDVDIDDSSSSDLGQYTPGYDMQENPVLTDANGYVQSIRVKLLPLSLGVNMTDIANEIAYTLNNTTSFKGVCMNIGDAGTLDYNFDNNKQKIEKDTVDLAAIKAVTANMECRDFGGYTDVKAEIKFGNNIIAVCNLPIPLDTDHDWLPDSFETQHEEDGNNNITLLNDSDNFSGDIDRYYDGDDLLQTDSSLNIWTNDPAKGTIGDGIPAIEEYRGFIYNDNNNANPKHHRLDPHTKDLFVASEIKDLNFDLGIGLMEQMNPGLLVHRVNSDPGEGDLQIDVLSRIINRNSLNSRPNNGNPYKAGWPIIQRGLHLVDDFSPSGEAHGTALTGSIDTGENGVCETVAEPEDEQVIFFGFGGADVVAITAGPNGIIDPPTEGDDVVNANTLRITAGPNGILETAPFSDSDDKIHGEIKNASGILDSDTVDAVSGDDFLIGTIQEGSDGSIHPNSVDVTTDDDHSNLYIDAGTNGIIDTPVHASDTLSGNTIIPNDTKLHSGSNLAGDDIIKGYITSGPNGTIDSPVSSTDDFAGSLNSGANGILESQAHGADVVDGYIGPGLNGYLDPLLNNDLTTHALVFRDEDDTFNHSAGTITTGTIDKICSTTARGDDIQVIEVGNSQPYTDCIIRKDESYVVTTPNDAPTPSPRADDQYNGSEGQNIRAANLSPNEHSKLIIDIFSFQTFKFGTLYGDNGIYESGGGDDEGPIDLFPGEEPHAIRRAWVMKTMRHEIGHGIHCEHYKPMSHPVTNSGLPVGHILRSFDRDNDDAAAVLNKVFIPRNGANAPANIDSLRTTIYKNNAPLGPYDAVTIDQIKLHLKH